MKQYLLLSDNHQSGPFSLDELKEQHLQPLDLVWIEKESTSWAYASELKDLEGFVKEAKRSLPRSHQKNKNIFISLPPDFPGRHTHDVREEFAGLPANDNGSVLEPNYIRPLEALKERINEKNHNQPIWNRKIFYMNDAIRLAGVFVGLVFGAIIIKNAADSSSLSEQVATETSISSMIMEEKPVAATNYHNALVKEVVSPAEEKLPAKSVKPKDIRRQVKIKTNDYKTGVFGGINGLELTLLNASPHFIDKVVVTVNYFKKNGEQVESRSFDFTSVQPNSTRKLEVPANRRGFKVKTSVSTIYSKEYKAALKQA